MAQVATTDQKNAMRRKGQTSDLFVAIFAPQTIYSARLNGVPETTDMVAEITYDTGSGTLADVKPDMTLWVGTAAGAYDLGIARIRKAPSGTIFYIGEQSKIEWQDNCYLTVVNDFDLKAKHIHIDPSGTALMDYDVAYSDQHTNFNPVPVLGPIVRVKKLEGANVAVQLGSETGYESYVFGGTISSYLWECATATFNNAAIARPVATFTATGWHVVYCTVTASNGKTKQGMRYVYIWSDVDQPYKISDVTMDESEDAGGGNFSVTFAADAGITDIPNRALCVLFAVDRYDSYDSGTQDNVGPIVDAENIEYIGRIMSESIRYDAVRSEVSFEVEGFHEWFKKIPGFPSGLELATDTPARWTDMPALTVDRAVWHFLEWRCTATRMMDVILTGDDRYAVELSSLNNDLWSQLEEFAYMTIFAFPAVDMFGRFFLQIEPQLTPEADRSFVEVMDLEKTDFYGEVNVERIVTPEISQVDLSGITVDESAAASSVFSLSPGHVPDYHGSIEIGDRYLLADQTSANIVAGLIRQWKNNPYKPITLNLLNNKMVSCFPNQYVGFTIDAADTIRGVGYSGRLIPIRRSLNFDPRSGFKSYTVDFEAEVLEGVAVDGDVPGSDVDPSIQPFPPFPPIPALPIFFPGLPSATPDGPPTVLLVDSLKGLIRTSNFNTNNPQWMFWNSGIATADITYIVDDDEEQGRVHVLITPSGSVWVGVKEKVFRRWLDTVYYAQGIGGQFVKIIDQAWLDANEPGGTVGISGIGYNPNKPEEIAFIAGDQDTFATSKHLWIGNRNGFTQKTAISMLGQFATMLTYGNNEWGHVTSNNGGSTKTFRRFAGDGSSVLSQVTITNILGDGATPDHVRAGTSKVIIAYASGDILSRSEDGGATFSDMEIADDEAFFKKFAIHPGGQLLMSGWDSNGGQRGKSSDGGVTWSGLPSLPFGGAYAFGYAGGDGTASRWIAARAVIRYSPDFGTTWQNKEGNISYLIPTGLSIRKVLVPGVANG